MSTNDDGRQSILDEAESLFARYGFKKTSIEDVAKAARIGKGSVYLHFASKEELFAEVVRRVSERMWHALVSAVGGARSPAARLRAFVEAKLTSVAEIVAEYHLDEETVMELLPLANALRQAHRAKELVLLQEVLRDGIAAGAFAVEHPKRVATGMMACLQALEASAVRLSDQPDVRGALGDLLAVFLRGLSPLPRRNGA